MFLRFPLPLLFPSFFYPFWGFLMDVFNYFVTKILAGKDISILSSLHILLKMERDVHA